MVNMTNTLAPSTAHDQATVDNGNAAPMQASQLQAPVPNGATTQTMAAASGAPSYAQSPNGAGAPANIQAMGGTAQVAPTYQNYTGYAPSVGNSVNTSYANQNATGYNASLVDPYGANQAYNQYTGLLQQSMAPQFQQENQNLQSDLAARGISDSGAASYEMGNLQAQQGATLAASEAPFVQQMYGYQQGDVSANQQAQNASSQFGASALNSAASANQAAYNNYADLNANSANQFGLSNLNAENSAAQYGASAYNNMSGANANIANNASLYNANMYNNNVNQNFNAYNNYQNELMGYGANTQNSELAAYLNSFGPQTGVTNAMNTATGQIGSAYSGAWNAAQNTTNAMIGGASSVAAAGAGG